MTDLVSSQALAAFIQVILIALVLAGDNALVIGLAAAGLPPERRKRAIAIGIVTATALRILCGAIATQLLQVLGFCALAAFFSFGSAGRCGARFTRRPKIKIKGTRGWRTAPSNVTPRWQ